MKALARSRPRAPLSPRENQQRQQIRQRQEELIRHRPTQRLEHVLQLACRAEQQRRNLTADIAHELRTPVSVMLTHAQNGLASECANEEHREAFEATQRAAQRMRRLIDSLLELAHLDGGQESIRREPFDLAAVARECIELVSPLAEERRIAIHCDLPASQCIGDSDRIGQVITKNPKGTIIGGVLGGAAGAAVSAIMKDKDVAGTLKPLLPSGR